MILPPRANKYLREMGELNGQVLRIFDYRKLSVIFRPDFNLGGGRKLNTAQISTFGATGMIFNGAYLKLRNYFHLLFAMDTLSATIYFFSGSLSFVLYSISILYFCYSILSIQSSLLKITALFSRRVLVYILIFST